MIVQGKFLFVWRSQLMACLLQAAGVFLLACAFACDVGFVALETGNSKSKCGSMTPTTNFSTTYYPLKFTSAMTHETPGNRLASPPPKRKGMTWGWNQHQAEFGIDFVGCGGLPFAPSAGGRCDPYQGDTNCELRRPLLCLNVTGAARPPYAVEGKDQGLPKEGYSGWSGGVFKLSRPVAGTSLVSRSDADRLCVEQFGPGYRLAEHHDGRYVVGMRNNAYYGKTWPKASHLSSGGWNLWAYGKIDRDVRFWVHIDDQPANCWTK